MKNKKTYTNEPLGKLRVVKDFLSQPEELVQAEDLVKITISLSRSSVEFFKRAAEENHTSYQKLIRRLLDDYSAQHLE